MPLDELLDGYRQYRLERKLPGDPEDGGALLASQLGFLPDLDYLRDGLERSFQCIREYGGQLAILLKDAPEACLRPAALLTEITTLLQWVDQQGWAADDIRLRPMARPSTKSRHPLAGYSKSVCHHWSNLFYTLEPDGINASYCPDAQDYDALMREFAMYVLAAQSTVEPEAYLIYCRKWWDTDLQPGRSPYGSDSIGSRVEKASLAMQRLSLPEYRDLFEALRRNQSDDGSAPQTFSQRFFAVRTAVMHPSNPKPLRDAAQAITLLLQGLASPRYRRRAGPRTGSRLGDRSSNHVEREQYRDGYIRVDESLCVSTTFETEHGIHFETVVDRPMEIKELATKLASGEATRDPAEDEQLIYATGNLEADALALAEAKLNGQQWIPVGDRVGAVEIDAVVLPAAESSGTETPPGVHPGTSSRWAADHRRRELMAHRLEPNRLQLPGVARVLKAIATIPTGSETAAALLCLHAAIALGRSLDQAVTLEVHPAWPGHSPQPGVIHYLVKDARWVVTALPPAWAEESVTQSEHPLWSQIQLNDQTGFKQLLERQQRLPNGRVVNAWSDARREAVATWLQECLPDCDRPLAACSSFLFHRLLDVTGGDVGIARLITGRKHAHSESVAHYANYDAGVLWRAYEKCWDGRVKHHAPKPATGAKLAPARKENSRSYGARRVPRLEAVKALMQRLQSRIRSSDGAERHNCYTAYTWAALVLGIALRPVTIPYLYPIAEGLDTGWIITFIDKARTDYHRRVNVIPPLLAAHLDRYTRYIRGLERVSGRMKPLPVLALRYQSPETGRFRTFQPGDFEQVCKPEFDLELYSLRRFVRTQLARDSGLNAEDVDVWMGHWFDGLSPHDRLSTYPMMRMQGVASGAATRLMESVSFTPMWIDR